MGHLLYRNPSTIDATIFLAIRKLLANIQHALIYIHYGRLQLAPALSEQLFLFPQVVAQPLPSFTATSAV